MRIELRRQVRASSVHVAKKALSTFDERANQLRRMTTPLAEASTMSNEIAPT